MSQNAQLPWLAELRALLQQKLADWSIEDTSQEPRLQAELKSLESRQTGFSLSLAKPDLASMLRHQLESEYAAVLERMQAVRDQLAAFATRTEDVTSVVDEQAIVSRLHRLHQVLADNNPTHGNLELALHIDRIECFEGGKVKLRTCKLGGSPDAVELLAASIPLPEEQEPQTTDEQPHQAKPRRRTRRKFFDEGRGSNADRALADFAADPHRFAGLPDEFFWTDEFQLPEKKHWFQAMAIEAWNYWKAVPGRSKVQVAKHYGKSLPTIRRTLAYAEEQLAKR